MGLSDAGVLRPGARGDLAVWDVDGVVDDPFAAVLSSGSCRETILFGLPVFSADEAAGEAAEDIAEVPA
jgi:imidazolonepropionase-like amidohydrolase